MRQDRSQEGFSLLAVLALALLATFAAFAALRMFQQESKAVVSTINRDRLEMALDSGLDKAVFQLNQSTPDGWTGTTATAFYNSLTYSTNAFTDISGVKYWVKVLQGRRVQPGSLTGTGRPNANALSLASADDIASALTNTGDLSLDRTVIVMARADSAATQRSVSLTAMAYLHRNDISPVIQIGGIYSNGTSALGGSTGNSFDSCGSGISVTGCTGTIIGGAAGCTTCTAISGGGSDCLAQATPTVPAPYPPVVAPAGLVPWPFDATPNTLITQNYTAPVGNHSYSYSLAADTNVGVGNVDLGNDDFHIVTNGHQLNIYCTGTFGANGNPGWYVDDPAAPGTTTGGHPSQCWVYVVGSGAVSMGGTGNYELVMVAPQSTVTVNGNGSIYGAVVANTFTKTGASGVFHFDSCILQKYKANTYQNPPIVNVGWSQF